MNYLRLLQTRRMGAMLAPDAGGSAPAEAGAAQDAQQDANTDSDDGSGQEARTFTQEDVDRIVRREQAKWRRQQEAAVKNARTEAERLASMSAEERAGEQARQREQELDRREAEVTRRELQAQALHTLAQEHLPEELSQMLDYSNADACSESIRRIKGVWQRAVQQGVESRVAAGAPKAGDGKTRPADMRGAIAEHYGRA